MRGDQQLEVSRESHPDYRHRRTVVMKPTRSMIDQSFGKLDAIVKQTMERTGVPGIALAVVFDDQVVYQNGYGFCCTETKERVQAETVFQMTSLSKPVSATIMAGLGAATVAKLIPNEG